MPPNSVDHPSSSSTTANNDDDKSNPDDVKGQVPVPSMNIVIQVVGSRGDVQPFVALGVALQHDGHRVRLATHDAFADFVRSSGLEFFPIGGDPEYLMAYMVRHPGLMPSIGSLFSGEVTRKRRMVEEMLLGLWKSCVEPDPVADDPFVADAIIANPPGFAHVHCAQALGVPVHLMFTMPWTPTTQLPHPFTAGKKREKRNRAPRKQRSDNYWSYGMVDYMTWQGLGDVINRWRRRHLGLENIQDSAGNELLDIVRPPFTYCWSPSLVARPKDWRSNIDVCGFFMRAEPAYEPPERLAAFLASGPPPIFIGFGSIVIDDPLKVTECILASCRSAGTRLILSRGWSKLGAGLEDSDRVLLLDDCPHEWLFKRVSVVVHHGGAGTTACGLINARPTIIVPFFGDQFFWGSIVAGRGAGPEPIPYKNLDAQKLATAIQYCLTDAAQTAALVIAEGMRTEDGVDAAVRSFYRHLPMDAMRCDVLPDRVARWRCQGADHAKGQRIELSLSDAALSDLLADGRVSKATVRPLRTKEYDMDPKRWDPLTAGLASVVDTFFEFSMSLAEGIFEPPRAFARAHKQTGRRSEGVRAFTSAAGRSAKGCGSALVKGTFVQVPMAVTTGFRTLPRFIGGHVDEPPHVADWASGCRAAGENFRRELRQGARGVALEPWRVARSQGAAGLFRGIGGGCLSAVTKAGSGLYAYPAHGAYRSIKKTHRAKTEALICKKMELSRASTREHDRGRDRAAAVF